MSFEKPSESFLRMNAEVQQCVGRIRSADFATFLAFVLLNIIAYRIEARVFAAIVTGLLVWKYVLVVLLASVADRACMVFKSDELEQSKVVLRNRERFMKLVGAVTGVQRVVVSMIYAVAFTCATALVVDMFVTHPITLSLGFLLALVLQVVGVAVFTFRFISISDDTLTADHRGIDEAIESSTNLLRRLNAF